MPRILRRGRCYGAQIAVPCKTSVGIHSRAGGHAGLPYSVVYGGKNKVVGIADHFMTLTRCMESPAPGNIAGIYP